MAFKDDIQKLHSRRDITISFRLTPDNQYRWIAVISGVDFLDGDWSKTLSGEEPSVKRAMAQIRKQVFNGR